MDITLAQIIDFALKFGLGGIVAIVWYFDRKDMAIVMEERRRETAEILKKYELDAKEARENYKNNVHLVQSYQSIASDLHSTVVLNTQRLQTMEDSVRTNQFCPFTRVDKTKIEVIKP